MEILLSSTILLRWGINSTNLVKVLKDDEGNRVEDWEQIKSMVVGYYQKLLGSTNHDFSSEKADRITKLITRKFSSACVGDMAADVTREDIWKVVFSFNKNKAPGPDGFPTEFFQRAWPIVGEDVTEAILDFFSYGKLLREVNATIITLVPKRSNPSVVGDFRPISCCNIVSITKIIANRFLKGLDDIVGPNQGAFIPGRSIAENIMLVQELVCNNHREKGRPRCTIKVDLMNAYDSVNWSFLLHCLKCFGAPRKFLGWTHECISSPSYSVALNGSLVGYFPGQKGLRQGDPMSPYLFVIAMEVLSLLLEWTAADPHFGFHPRRHSLQLTHLCFANDLLIFVNC
jgi:hypothetical protein